MKLVRIHGENDARMDEVQRPEVRANDVLIKVRACGICGTDLGFIRAGTTLKDEQPLPLGHEAAGEVVEVGSAVTAVAPGARVVINPMNDLANVIGNGGTEGAFGDYLLVRDFDPPRGLLVMPEDMDYDVAALVEPLGVSLHAVNRSGAQAHHRVVVFGAGPIGLGIVFWLKQRGCRHVVAVDLSPSRLDRAKALGADETVQAGTDLLEPLRRWHGEGVFLGQPAAGTDIYIDAAGANAVIHQVIGLAKTGARLAVVAVHREPVTLDFSTLLVKELEIVMAMGYPNEFPEVLATLARERDTLKVMISHRFDFDEFFAALAVAGSTSEAAKVMVTFPACY